MPALLVPVSPPSLSTLRIPPGRRDADVFPTDSCLVDAPRVIARCRVWMRRRHAEPMHYGHKSAFEFLRVEQILPYPRIRLADLAVLPEESFSRGEAAGSSGRGAAVDGDGLEHPSTAGRPHTARSGAAGNPAEIRGGGGGMHTAAGSAFGHPPQRSHTGRLPLSAEARRAGKFGLHGAGGAPLRRWEASLLKAQAQTARSSRPPPAARHACPPCRAPSAPREPCWRTRARPTDRARAADQQGVGGFSSLSAPTCMTPAAVLLPVVLRPRQVALEEEVQALELGLKRAHGGGGRGGSGSRSYEAARGLGS